jgi:hypothetical protein
VSGRLGLGVYQAQLSGWDRVKGEGVGRGWMQDQVKVTEARRVPALSGPARRRRTQVNHTFVRVQGIWRIYK